MLMPRYMQDAVTSSGTSGVQSMEPSQRELQECRLVQEWVMYNNQGKAEVGVIAERTCARHGSRCVA